MNKKGVIGEGIMDIVSIKLIFITLVLFFFLIKYNLNFENFFRSEGKIYASEGEISNNIMLLNYLRTPYEKGNIADLITKSVKSSDFKELDSITREIFKDSNSCFYLFIGAANTKICPKKELGMKLKEFRSEGSVLIPTKEKDIIEVKIMGIGEFYE